ncbi:unnamed protein product [Schistosoma bovis]|nr:unnamed protein product [Schistosoma bovis]
MLFCPVRIEHVQIRSKYNVWLLCNTECLQFWKSASIHNQKCAIPVNTSNASKRRNKPTWLPSRLSTNNINAVQEETQKLSEGVRKIKTVMIYKYYQLKWNQKTNNVQLKGSKGTNCKCIYGGIFTHKIFKMNVTIITRVTPDELDIFDVVTATTSLGIISHLRRI